MSMSIARVWFVVPCVAALLAGSAAADTVILKNGTRLSGEVVKRNDRQVWIDLGPDIVELNLDAVASVEISTNEASVEVEAETLYRTARNLPELSPREHAKRIGPAVIMVETPSGLGSGVIVNPEGYAITNAHVIQGETALKATVWFEQPDGSLKRTVIEDVEIAAVNNHLDLALIRISHPEEDGRFVFAPLEREPNLEVGQDVFAIGNPMGLERSLSRGVVSTTGRNYEGFPYIQTDTAINPGNSGGPLFNLHGEVVGITNMGYMFTQGLNFAIPARYVKDFIRSRESFAYDKDNPNSGYSYLEPPTRRAFGTAGELRDGSADGAGTEASSR